RSHEGHITVNAYHRPSFLNTIILIVIGLLLSGAMLFLSKFLSLIFAIAILVITPLAIWLSSKFFGIDNETLNRFKKWVISDETLVIAQVNSHDVRKALAILRHVESGHPISFLLRSATFAPFEQEAEEQFKEPLTAEQMSERAQKLSHTLKNAS